MEAIIRTVKDIESDQRHWFEAAIGHQLQDDQQIIIRVLTPGVVGNQVERDAAFADLKQLSSLGATNREAHGVPEAEGDAALEEAMQHVRRRGRP
ncbi:MAG: hypothetical protein JSS02_26345 [Planctomycetes bacterium]|nr:hypothetical protein [Planctomycetota bacterium]